MYFTLVIHNSSLLPKPRTHTFNIPSLNSTFSIPYHLLSLFSFISHFSSSLSLIIPLFSHLLSLSLFLHFSSSCSPTPSSHPPSSSNRPHIPQWRRGGSRKSPSFSLPIAPSNSLIMTSIPTLLLWSHEEIKERFLCPRSSSFRLSSSRVRVSVTSCLTPFLRLFLASCFSFPLLLPLSRTISLQVENVFDVVAVSP